MEIGLGLWTMRSTAAYPAAFPRLYSELGEDARLAEALGFHSLWIAEHHAWYDGWCPSPLVAAASVLAATTTLHAGTGIHLLPLYDPERIATQIAWLQRESGGRLQYGVGLGYRTPEYDAFGRSRRQRGRRMDAALDRVAALGDGAPPVWVGGFSEPALQRAARRGHGVLLPHTLAPAQLTAAIEHVGEVAAAAERTSPIGLIRYAWPTDGSAAERERAIALLNDFTREYWGAWFSLKGRHAFDVPDLLERQLRRGTDEALIGTPEAIATGLAELEAAGVQLCVLHLAGDGRLPERREAMAAIAEHALGVRA